MVYANTITLLIIISLLTSQIIFTVEADDEDEQTAKNKTCSLYQSNNKSAFDFADSNEPPNFFVIIVHNRGNEKKMYLFGVNYEKQSTDRREQLHMNVHSVYNYTRIIQKWFKIPGLLSCQFKENPDQFDCNDINKVNALLDQFGCPDQPIDMRSLITYHPYSYQTSDVTRNLVLFVGRRRRTIMITDWTNHSSPVCRQMTNTDKNSIVPKFLHNIEKRLEITAIVGTWNASNDNSPSALMLFYHSGEHKYCFTPESELSETCLIKNLKTYLKCAHQMGATDSTEEEEESTTPMLTPTNYVVKNTTHSLPSNKPSKPKSIWIVMAIIALVLVIIAFIIGVCFVIYSVYRSKNKTQTGKTNDESDKQISDSTAGSQPQQQSESSDQKDETSVEKNT